MPPSRGTGTLNSSWASPWPRRSQVGSAGLDVPEERDDDAVRRQRFPAAGQLPWDGQRRVLVVLVRHPGGERDGTMTGPVSTSLGWLAIATPCRYDSTPSCPPSIDRRAGACRLLAVGVGVLGDPSQHLPHDLGLRRAGPAPPVRPDRRTRPGPQAAHHLGRPTARRCRDRRCGEEPPSFPLVTPSVAESGRSVRSMLAGSRRAERPVRRGARSGCPGSGWSCRLMTVVLPAWAVHGSGPAAPASPRTSPQLAPTPRRS